MSEPRQTGTRTYNVLVIGAGPAGIAAACSAAECGASVAMIDNNPRVGGQIWRGETREHAQTHEAQSWLDKLAKQRIEFFPSTEIIDHIQPGLLLAQSNGAACKFAYKKLLLCTGARELFLPFPGWTLPNVMGAGGLQALVKSGLRILGKRIVVAGSGPLLLAVAAHLREHGAEVRLIAEQAPFHRLASFSISLVSSKSKFAQALTIRRKLSGIPYKTSCWPICAEGRDKLESVTLRHGSKAWKEPCDYLACGFHLVPNIELASLFGCEIRGGFARVNEFQESSVKGIFCAGELTGIGGVDSSLVEGRIAGCAAAGNSARARQFSREKHSVTHFANALRRTFALRSELRSLATPETIICRCEDVKFSRLLSYPSWRAAKLQTRCGMGPCQGRICGTATQFLFGWKPDSARSPVFAAPLEILAQAGVRAPEQAVNQ